MALALCVLFFLVVLPAVAAGQRTVHPDSVRYAWSTGPYTYDGSGNIVVIGPQRTNDQNGKTDYYVYDAVSRLHKATAHTPSFGNQQLFGYDIYGNLRQIDTTTTPGGTAASTFAVNTSTNQLTNADACAPGTTCFLGTYDEAGNQIGSSNGISSQWDPLGMMTGLEAGSRREWYVYDSNNERVLIDRRAPAPASAETRMYSMRGADKRVLREVVQSVANGQHQWTWQKDYVLAGSRLAAAVTPGDIAGEVRRHFHVDHLGTPLLITDDRGFRLALHKYAPFGADAPGSDLDDERMKFTGHERDFGAGDGQDLDYMHARYYSPAMSRFLTTDPVVDLAANLISPQRWNLYSYVAGNPVNATDPTGAILRSRTGRKRLLDIAGDAAGRISFDNDGAIDVSQLTADDLANNEGALLLYEMAKSDQVYTYEESATTNTRGGAVPTDGLLNLDDNPTDAFVNGQPWPKQSTRFPPADVNGAVTIDPAARWTDEASGQLQVPLHAIAFHELAESFAKVEMNIVRGPSWPTCDGRPPGAHNLAQQREQYLMQQRPWWTPYPAGGNLRR